MRRVSILHLDPEQSLVRRSNFIFWAKRASVCFSAAFLVTTLVTLPLRAEEGGVATQDSTTVAKGNAEPLGGAAHNSGMATGGAGESRASLNERARHAISLRFNELVRQKVCEDKGERGLFHIAAVSKSPSQNQELWFVSCAHWAVNASWVVFFVTESDAFENGLYIKQLMFVSYNPIEKGFVGSSVIHNYRWDPIGKVLYSSEAYDTTSECKSVFGFQWSEAQQDFILKTTSSTTETCRWGGEGQRQEPKREEPAARRDPHSEPKGVASGLKDL